MEEFEFQEWMANPHTVFMMNKVREELKAVQDTLTRGAFRHSTCDEFAMESMKLMGRIQGLSSILELKPK